MKVLASLQGSDFLVAQESPEDCTEIKRHEIINNALDIDLENVFETVTKETGVKVKRHQSSLRSRQLDIQKQKRMKKKFLFCLILKEERISGKI